MARSNNSQLRALQEQFEAMASPQAQQFFYERVARECAARFLGKVIRKTPVGKNAYSEEETGEVYKSGKKKGQAKTKRVVSRQGGTLRRGWTAKTHEEAASGSGAGTPPAQYAQDMPVSNDGGVYSITITNSVEYASYVESGHRQQPGRFVPAIGKRLKKSWVEGQFMLAKSEAEMKAEIPAVLKRNLSNYLRAGSGGGSDENS